MTDTVARPCRADVGPSPRPGIDMDTLLDAIPAWICEQLSARGLTIDIVEADGTPTMSASSGRPIAASLGLAVVSMQQVVERRDAASDALRDVPFLAIPIAATGESATEVPLGIGDHHSLVAAALLGPAAASRRAQRDPPESSGMVLALYRSNGDADSPASRAADGLLRTLEAERAYAAELRATLHRVLDSSFWRRSAPLRRLLARARGRTHQEPRIAERPPEITIASPPALAGTSVVAAASTMAKTILPRSAATAGDAAASTSPTSSPTRPLVVMVMETFDVGGLEKVVLDLSLRLTARGLNVEILVVKHGGQIARQARAAGLAVTELGGDLEAMTAFIEHRRPAVAIRHHSYPCHDVFLRVGTRVIEVLHNIYHWQQGNGTVLDYRRTTWRIVACSRAVQRYAIEHLGVEPGRIELIHNGIDDTGLVRPERDALRAGRRRSPHTIFLMTSHIWANKSHLALLSAFEDVHRIHPQARLVCRGTVGDADVAEALHRRVLAAGLRGVVDIGNSPDRLAISRDYTGAHAVVLPSIVEGFSISTLEATYFGLPLILSDTGGARDLLLDAAAGAPPAGIIIEPPIPVADVTPQAVDRVGRLNRPSQVPALARAMREIVLHRDAWIDRGLAAIDRIGPFHIDRTVESYLQLIEAAIRAKTPH